HTPRLRRRPRDPAAHPIGAPPRLPGRARARPDPALPAPRLLRQAAGSIPGLMPPVKRPAAHPRTTAGQRAPARRGWLVRAGPPAEPRTGGRAGLLEPRSWRAART